MKNSEKKNIEKITFKAPEWPIIYLLTCLHTPAFFFLLPARPQSQKSINLSKKKNRNQYLPNQKSIKQCYTPTNARDVSKTTQNHGVKHYPTRISNHNGVVPQVHIDRRHQTQFRAQSLHTSQRRPLQKHIVLC